jgi:nitroreductase
MEETLDSFAAQLSCKQRKAADACFTACMLSEFEEPLKRFGAWIYPYLFWECGILGQLLYLEAEAYGLRGCGIGCFFDDPLHDAIGLIGLKGREFQDLYHFAVGYPLPEIGVITLPAYEK